MRDTEQPKANSTQLNTGDVLQSRYRILHSLGSEGCRTYLAEDLNRFNERCVLKEFAPQLKETFALDKAQLFEREAGVLYRLKHPQIPKFRQPFSYKRQDEEFIFLVQDYVEGITYHALLDRRIKTGDRATEAEIKQLLTQVLPILEYIHSMGIIHRDISPDNLILRQQDRRTVLIDFGCIKTVEIKTQSELIQATANPDIPLVSTALGKSGYAPPEQVERGIVYAHSDLYALAAICVVWLTGKEPQELIDPKDYRWHWQTQVNLSPKLEWILSTMLSPHPSERFCSAAEVNKTLQDSLITSQSTQTEIETPRSFKRQRLRQTIATSNLFTKSFLIPFSAVLILGGLCLIAVIKAIDLANTDSVEADIRLQDRFSQGERILIPQITTPEKELAAIAFTKGSYYQAASFNPTRISIQKSLYDPNLSTAGASKRVSGTPPRPT